MSEHDPTHSAAGGLDPDKLGKALDALLRIVPATVDATLRDQIGEKKAKKLTRKLDQLAPRIAAIAESLDPVRPPHRIIQLSDPATIGRLIGRELEGIEPIPLSDVPAFYGSGVYALYYSGDFPAYEAIAGTDVPIYVGKADPATENAKTPREQGKSLAGRLAKHGRNLSNAKHLRLADFRCRYLATQSGWEVSAEAYLIQLYKPVWNKEVGVCSGFGKHGDIARTELSSWDVLHSGRSWTGQQTSRRGKTSESVAADIERHYVHLYESDPERWGKLLNPVWVRSRFGAPPQPT